MDGLLELSEDSREISEEFQSSLDFSSPVLLENSPCLHFPNPYIDLPILETVTGLVSFPFPCIKIWKHSQYYKP